MGAKYPLSEMMSGVSFEANFRIREKGMWGVISLLTTQLNNPCLIFFPLSFSASW